MKNSEKGITLIALIITIIVMLILVAVTINVALNGRLFDRAKGAADSTQKQAEKEELMSVAFGTLDNKGELKITKGALDEALSKGWAVGNNSIKDSKNQEWYLCTSPKGNLYYLNSTTGEIIEEAPPEGGEFKINRETAELHNVGDTLTLTASGKGAETCTWESSDTDLLIIEGTATGKTVTIKRVGISNDPLCFETITATNEDNAQAECGVLLEGKIIYMVDGGYENDENEFEEVDETMTIMSTPVYNNTTETYEGLILLGEEPSNYSIDKNNEVITIDLTDTILKGDILEHDENYQNFICTVLTSNIYVNHEILYGSLLMTSKDYLSDEFNGKKFASENGQCDLEFNNAPDGKYPAFIKSDKYKINGPYYVKYDKYNNPEKIYGCKYIFTVKKVDDKTAIHREFDKNDPDMFIQE